MNNETKLENIRTCWIDEKKGTTQVIGLHYHDLKSLVTAASLFNHQEREKAWKELQAVDPKAKDARRKLNDAVETMTYCIDRETLIDAIQKSITYAIDLSNNPKLPPYQYKPSSSDPFYVMKSEIEDKTEEIRRAEQLPDETPPQEVSTVYYPVNSPQPIPSGSPLLVVGEYGLPQLAVYVAPKLGGERRFCKFPMVGGEDVPVGQVVVKWAELPK